MTPQRQHTIATRYQPLNTLTVQDIRAMYRVFCRHYDHVSLEQFLSDLNRKEGAFIVRRDLDGDIVGFSTLGISTLEVGGRRVRGLFSGDTILEPQYWGQRTINAAFLKQALWRALKDPFTPQYWFLISKGYKTFLLLSRNFPEFYPHPDRETPHLKAIAEAYCDELFPGLLDREAMLLDFGPDSHCLREHVTPITPELRCEPHIAFFERRNPTWARGTELPCVGRADLSTFFQVMGPQIMKLLLQPTRREAGWRQRLEGRWAASAWAKALARRRQPAQG